MQQKSIQRTGSLVKEYTQQMDFKAFQEDAEGV